MRLLYIDIDTLRPDHLGCYGYPRDTSPNIDAIAGNGIRFEGVYTSDSPCLPSRTALTTGRFGIRTGVVNHGGTRAEPYPGGVERRRVDQRWAGTWPSLLRSTGLHTATISTFAERHSAYHWYAGFNEVLNLGAAGHETADQVFALAADWLKRRGGADGWFLHVHFWDPHTPYRAPLETTSQLGPPALPGWLDAEEVERQQGRTGPHSAREPTGWDDTLPAGNTGVHRVAGVEDAVALIDGYDRGVRYVDDHVGRMMDLLEKLGVADEVAILISGDHGESLGELGIWCDHQTADLTTHRLPAVLRWPGIGPGVDRELRYQFDLAATLAEMCGARVPPEWDGRSFAGALEDGDCGPGRDELVLSCGAWTVQRSVRFGRWLCIWSYHDGFHGYPEVMLFDVESDPGECTDRSAEEPGVVGEAAARLAGWSAEVMSRSGRGEDPLWTVVGEGGGLYVRDRLDRYLERLRHTDRAAMAKALAARPRPVGSLL